MFKKTVISLFLLYTILGFFALPYFLKPQLIEIIESQTDSRVSINNISFNPFIFNLTLDGLELKTLDNKHLLSFNSLQINNEPSSFLFGTIHVKEIILDKPNISLIYNRDKTFNILSIIKKSKQTPQKEEASTAMPRVKLDEITIVDGSIAYEDFTQKSKFDFIFDDIGFSLRDVDTDDFNSSDAELRFYSTLGDGGFVDLKTQIIGFEPFKLKGSLDFQASKLYTQWRYMKDSLNLEVANGSLSFHSEYSLNLDDLNATTIDNVRVDLNALRIKPKNENHDVLNLDSFFIDNVTIKPMQKSIHVAEIALDSLHVKASRNKKGEVDWLEYIKVDLPDSNETQQTEAETNSSEPWKLHVDKLALNKIGVDFLDEGVSPAVTTTLNEFNLSAQNITLAGKEPMRYKMNMLLNDAFTCRASGDVVHNVLEVNTELTCSDFNIVHYRPYIDEIAKESLKTYNVKLIRAKAGFDAKVNVRDVKKEIVIDVENANFNLDKFALNQRSNSKRLVNFSSFKIKDIALNTDKKNLTLAKVSLDGLDIKAVRLKDESINFDGLVVPRVTKNSNKKEPKEEEYRVKLKHFALNRAKVTFEDRLLTPRVKSKIDKIDFDAYNIDSQKKSWLSYRFSSRVNSKGYIKSKGSLRHTPLKQKGTFVLDKISLTELNPYIQEKAFVELGDGYINIEATTSYSQSSIRPDLRVKGSLHVQELFLNNTKTDAALLSFNDFGFNSFTLELLPNRLYIDEANLDSFYVDALINERKELNFSLLMKEPKEKLEVKEESSTKESEPFPVKVVKFDVNGGSAKFADLSIPLQFRTHIHDLNGEIYSISSNPNETSYVDIKGEIDKYGAMKLKGSVNASKPKEYTDLALSFSNLTLNSFSGYSATFAGHEIESGKLYLDLAYEIEKSKIKGDNSVIVKQMKLGREIEDENITSIPLGFIIGLLEDSDGIIDIKMPVEGNVDAPDFKYGALVFETFGDLLLQAVTSPFRFLGSVLGMDGDALEYGEFEAGKNIILAPEREKLDNIAKMMIKRPKISLGIKGSYNEIVDKRALQREKLITLIVKESGIQNRDEHKSAMTADMLEDIYEDIRDDDRVEKIEEELEKEYEGEAFNRAYLKALVRETTLLQVVTKVELEALAHSRADIFKEYLIEQKSIDPKRLRSLDIVVAEDSDEEHVKVKFEIEVK